MATAVIWCNLVPLLAQATLLPERAFADVAVIAAEAGRVADPTSAN